MEHIEEAGIHSGRFSLLPAALLFARETVAIIKDQARALARELDVRGT